MFFLALAATIEGGFVNICVFLATARLAQVSFPPVFALNRGTRICTCTCTLSTDYLYSISTMFYSPAALFDWVTLSVYGSLGTGFGAYCHRLIPGLIGICRVTQRFAV